MPKLIAKAFADFLFGEDPSFSTANEGEQDVLDSAVEENRLGNGLQRAARLCVSEGEVWWKLHTNPDIVEAPILEWLGRLSVVPLFYGDRLLACAFVTVVARTHEQGDKPNETIEIVWRHAEVHAEGQVQNVLYRGGCDELGLRVALNQRPETAEMLEEWDHGLAMLAGRVVNDIDEDTKLGDSDYDQIEDLLLALNEGVTISAENARLTGKDRAFVAGRVLEPDGSFDASIDVMRIESEGGTLGEGDGKPPVVAWEKHYDAESLWFHIGKLTSVTLSRVGLVVQLIDTSNEGTAESGTAIRLRFLPTVNAASGKAREWDAKLPQILDLLLKVGALSTEQGGFDWNYTGKELPTVERSDILPADDTEIVTRNSQAVVSGIRSRWTAIQEQHPEWSDAEIGAEMARIQKDESFGPPEPTDVPNPNGNEPAPVPVA